MRFTAEIGQKERHVVEFHFNQITGFLIVKVDAKVILRDFRFLSFGVLKVYAFTVGEREKLFVQLQKERKLFLSFLFPQTYRLLVDGKLVKELHGY